MSSNKELKVILSKVGWCGHCTDFLPVFNESKNLIKNNKILKNVNVDFEVYDMEQDKGIFETKYSNLVDKVEGYPTVFLAQIKNEKLSKTVEIGHSKDPEDFVKLISDAYKSFSKQTGGNNNENDLKTESNIIDDPYKQKYLKYKAKYLKLKEQYGGEEIYKLILNKSYTIEKDRTKCDPLRPCQSVYRVQISDEIIKEKLVSAAILCHSHKYCDLSTHDNLLVEVEMKKHKFNFSTYVDENLLLNRFKKKFKLQNLGYFNAEGRDNFIKQIFTLDNPRIQYQLDNSPNESLLYKAYELLKKDINILLCINKRDIEIEIKPKNKDFMDLMEKIPTNCKMDHAIFVS